MQMTNERILSEAIKYYEDFDGELEESLFNWLVKRATKCNEYEQVLEEFAKHGTRHVTTPITVLNDPQQAVSFLYSYIQDMHATVRKMAKYAISQPLPEE